jgi:leucyl/phenylalanyl-tRNA---protein transferase
VTEKITPEMLLRAYAAGVFPMADSQENPEIFWVDPLDRGILPLDKFHISRTLKRNIRHETFQIRTNFDFFSVLKGCADRNETWINDSIFQLYLSLHEMGFAHSMEVWQEDTLVGGVYGVALGGAFFGESMFSRRKDASKIALAYLVDRLRVGGFTLFDTQFITPHLASLGAVEISRAHYRELLEQALLVNADFNRQVGTPSGQDVIQRNTQTS